MAETPGLGAYVENPTPVRRAEEQRVDAFISYAREDQEVLEEVRLELLERGATTWVDTRGLLAGEPWSSDISAAIEVARNFLVLLTPRWLHSSACRDELAYALDCGKRIVPLVAGPVEHLPMPQELAERQWLFWGRRVREVEVADLASALDADPQHVRRHTWVLRRAVDWLAQERSEALLLRGAELEHAERWLVDSEEHADPHPTSLQVAFLAAGRRVADVELAMTLVNAPGDENAALRAALAGSDAAGESGSVVPPERALAAVCAAVVAAESSFSLSMVGVTDIQISGDGRRVMARGGSGVQVWDTVRRTPVLALTSDDSPPVATLSRDGARLVTVLERCVSMWDLDSTSRLDLPPCAATDPLVHPVLSPDGSALVMWTGDFRGHVIDAGTGELLWTSPGLGNPVARYDDGPRGLHYEAEIGFSRDGSRFVTVQDDRATVHQTDSGSVHATFQLGRSERATQAWLSADGQLMVSTNGTRRVRPWSCESGQLLRTFQVRQDFDNGVFAEAAYAADLPLSGRYLRARHYSGESTWVWSLDSGRSVKRVGFQHLDCDDSGRFFFEWGNTPTWRMWDTNLSAAPVTRHFPAWVTSGMATTAGVSIAGTRSGQVVVWPFDSEQPSATFGGHSGPVTKVAASEDVGGHRQHVE